MNNQRLLGRVINLITGGAEVRQVKGIGVFIVPGKKRTRRTKEEMVRDKKKDD